MKIALVSRNLGENSPLFRWILSLTKAACEHGHEVHVIAETVSGGKVSSAGGQAHVIESVRWGGSFGRWVFARRARKELKAEPLDTILSCGDILDPDILLVSDGDDKRVLKSLKQGRFGKAVVASESLKNDLVEQLGLDSQKVIVAGPPAPAAPDAEWENRARAFWSAVG